MKQELQTLLLKYVKSAEKIIPQAVEEFLNFRFYEHSIDVILYISLMIMCIIFIKKSLKKIISNENNHEQMPIWIFVTIICSLILVRTVYTSVCTTKKLIKLKVAPKVYIIDSVISKIEG